MKHTKGTELTVLLYSQKLNVVKYRLMCNHAPQQPNHKLNTIVNERFVPKYNHSAFFTFKFPKPNLSGKEQVKN